MHGPNHLLCSGVDCYSPTRALAIAAWAGWFAARGEHQNAAQWAAEAEKAAGERMWASHAPEKELFVVAVGGRPSAEENSFLIQSMQISLPAFERREQQQAVKDEKPVVTEEEIKGTEGVER